MPTKHTPTAAASPYDAVSHQDSYPHAQSVAYVEPDADQDSPDEASVQAELPPHDEATDDLDATAEHVVKHTPTAADLDHIIALICVANDAFQRLNDAVHAVNISVGQFAALRQHVNRGGGPRVAYNPTGIYRKRERG